MVSFLQISPPRPLLFPIRATCRAHLILLDFITRKILGEKYRSLSSSTCSFLTSGTLYRKYMATILTVKNDTIVNIQNVVYSSPAAEVLHIGNRAKVKHACTSLDGSGVFQKIWASKFQDDRHIEMVALLCSWNTLIFLFLISFLAFFYVLYVSHKLNFLMLSSLLS